MDPRDFRGLLRRTVLIPILLMLLLSCALIWQVISLTRAIRQVDLASRITTHARHFFRCTLDMESASRAYLLTGDQEFLKTYYEQEKPAREELNALNRELQGSPSQLALAQQLDGQWQKWNEFTNGLIDNRKAGHMPTAHSTLQSKALMDDVRVTRDQLATQSQRTHDTTYEHVWQLSRRWLFVIFGAIFLIGAAVTLLTYSSMRTLVDTYLRHLRYERNEHEQARNARNSLVTIIRSLKEGIITADDRGYVQMVNPEAERLLGVTEAQVVNRRVEDILQIADETSKQPLPLDPHDQRTALLLRTDGTHSLIEESASPVISEDGHLRGIVIVFRDVTERRHTEAVLRTSERLATIGRLAATIAHEIRNPLDAVLNLHYLLRNSSELSSDDKVNLEAAHDELQRIVQITSQLLSFNREARRPVSVDIGSLVDSVFALFAPKLNQASIEVFRDYCSNTSVTGMPGELRQVFTNLVANASEAIGKNGRILVRIQRSKDPRQPDRAGVRVLFADNGPGIPDRARRSLFTPFFTTKGERGTGLGLWVSLGIIQKHEGTMRVRTWTGEQHGTVFNIFLPEVPQSLVDQSERERQTA